MDKDTSLQPDKEILDIFRDLEEKARVLYPSLLSDIKGFSDNHISLESYQNFINALNQPPIITSSNHVNW
jgi:hypothetical protein